MRASLPLLLKHPASSEPVDEIRRLVQLTTTNYY
jgi:hypothetical protein